MRLTPAYSNWTKLNGFWNLTFELLLRTLAFELYVCPSQACTALFSISIDIWINSGNAKPKEVDKGELDSMPHHSVSVGVALSVLVLIANHLQYLNLHISSWVLRGRNIVLYMTKKDFCTEKQARFCNVLHLVCKHVEIGLFIFVQLLHRELGFQGNGYWSASCSWLGTKCSVTLHSFEIIAPIHSAWKSSGMRCAAMSKALFCNWALCWRRVLVCICFSQWEATFFNLDSWLSIKGIIQQNDAAGQYCKQLVKLLAQISFNGLHLTGQVSKVDYNSPESFLWPLSIVGFGQSHQCLQLHSHLVLWDWRLSWMKSAFGRSIFAWRGWDSKHRSAS